MTQILNGTLHVLSGVYLALVVALVLSIGESDDWHTIFASTFRRGAKFLLALLAVAAGVLILSY